MGKLLLYYKYVTIPQPNATMLEQKKFCQLHNIKGRILIAPEGINGTIAGTKEAIEAYRLFMDSHPLFSDIDFKETLGSAEYFPRLRTVVKKELINFRVPFEQRPHEKTGQHLTPEQVHALLQNKPENLVVLDARNNYESAIGTFQGAITPNIDNFRDLPGFIEKNVALFKDKHVLMFCTGGIRCEPASAYLNNLGIADKVYQIEGGICRYVEQFPDGYFRGKNYVFDGRVAVRITDDVLSQCYLCRIPCDEYTNCINASCNKQILACDTCLANFNTTCSAVCKKLVEDNAVVIRKIFRKVTSACALEGG